ncbi:MAG: glycosyltransferase [Desulfuromonas sp.]|nr:glycosyltransferase [Desulfuromonas sp.]
MCLSKPNLSIIIPVFNEAKTLQSLFAALELQRGLALEIIFSVSCCDDGSEMLIAQYSVRSKHKIVVVPSAKGRAVQMNRGAEKASGDLLLFLHADSSWHLPYLLRDAVEFFNQEAHACQPAQIAAHFRLKFQHKDKKQKFYRYLGEKSALNRHGTIYGDQGIMLGKSLWHGVGPYREDVSALEDVFFANAVEKKATWVLLPQLISTSTRRYVNEGICSRITLNTLLIIAGGTGLLDCSSSSPQAAAAPDGDRDQSVCQLLEYCAQRLQRLPIKQYFAFWYSCAHIIMEYSWFACYVCGWLIPYASAQQRESMLAVHERFVLPLLLKPPCGWILGILSWLVFYLFYLFVVYSGPILHGLKIHNSNLGELHDL